MLRRRQQASRRKRAGRRPAEVKISSLHWGERKSLLRRLRSKDFSFGKEVRTLGANFRNKSGKRVAEYVALLKSSQGVVLAEFSGLAMPGMNALRARVREAEGKFT